MDILQKPKKALKKFVSKVSIQTVIKNGDAEDTEPLSNSQTRGQWPLTTTVDLRDPKNWPAWKKDLAFVSLLVSTAVVGILKTLFVTTNSVIMAQYNVSYTAAAALTGVPFILAALSGLGSTVLSQAIGKRTIHIAATLVMLAGAVWNMRTMGSYPQFMFARILQGAGWGAFEGIVMLSIRDIFAPHELPLCFNVLSITSLFFTWGSPILGGYLSQSTFTFRAELLVVNMIQACSVLFALLFFPETSYKPSIPNPGSNTSFSIHSYVSSLRPLPYTASFTRTALQPIRALATPSAFFAVLIVGPITASTFGLSNSLSLLFTSNPVFLFPAHVGFLFILPAGLSLACAVIITVLMSVSRPPMASNKLLAPGIIVGLAGLLSFGLYTSMHLETQEQNQAHVASGLFARDEVASGLSLPVVSVLFGFLTAASAILGIGLHLHSDSMSWRQAEMRSAIEEAADIAIEGAGRTWIDVLSGIFIIAIPAFAGDGQNAGTATWLKDVVIAIMVFQMLACGLVGVVGWRIGEKVKVLDGNIVGINTVKDGARKEGIFSA